MDIFDLDLKEFEKKINQLLDSLSKDELLKELVDNGLIIDEYEKNICYDTDIDVENTWVHKNRTSMFEKIKLSKKRESNLLEAA